MSVLTPHQAAVIAQRVYGLRDQQVSDLYRRQVGGGADGGSSDLGCEDYFSVGNDSRFTARSGGAGYSAITGFGYIAPGRGAFAGDVLVVTRGTASGHDWVSNLNIGLDRCSSGTMVHAGFNRVWSGFAPRVREWFSRNNPTRIHCVGHSLGGALATLNADCFGALGIGEVVLYTFGSPRVGSKPFGERLTQRIGGGNIHRVAHPADPVPMIPLLPFFHVPWATGGIMLPNPAGAIVGIDHHLMGPTYVPATANQSWSGLRAAAVNPNADAEVRNWLQRAADNSGNGLLMGSASLLTMIGRALGWILAQAGKLVANTLSAAATGGLTLLDRLAWMITEGARVSAELAGYTLTLLRAIFRFLGRVANTAAEITTAFLRWVLNLLFTTVSTAARAALDGVARLAR